MKNKKVVVKFNSYIWTASAVIFIISTPYVIYDSGIYSVSSLLFTVSTILSSIISFCYHPYLKITLDRNEVVKREGVGIGEWIIWRRVMRLSWKNLDQITGLFGHLPPKWVFIFGEVEVERMGLFKGREHKFTQIDLPTSPLPQLFGNFTDEAIAFACSQAPARQIRPDVVRYLQSVGWYDPDHHPAPDECGADVKEKSLADL